MRQTVPRVLTLLLVTLLTLPSHARTTARYVPGHLLVRFKSATANSAMAETHKRHGGKIKMRFQKIKNLQLIELSQGQSTEQALAEYRKDPNVLYAELDYVRRATGIPNDPSFGSQWALNNTGQTGGTSAADIHAVKAWDITHGSRNVVIAIVDTGIDYRHPDLAANVFSNPNDCDSNGVDDDHNGWIDDCHGIDTFNNDSDPLDDAGHGTHVAGTIGAIGNNATGVAGVNWEVTLLPCKFLSSDGFGFDSGAIACLDYLLVMKSKGVNIVASNNSWGGPGNSQALEDAIIAQGDAGILFIAAAGNSSADVDTHPSYPAGFSLPNLISVAATTSSDSLAGFSNRGRHTVHLGAPGSSIFSTLPGSYGTLSGTSMASPHVAGVVALLAAQDPNRDWRALRNLVLAGADPRSSLGATITGGRLNALGSLTCGNAPVSSRVAPQLSNIRVVEATPLELDFLHINCAAPAGAVEVTVEPGGEVTTLRDDGTSGDRYAGDGTYSATWTPTQDGDYQLTFPGSDIVQVHVAPPTPVLLSSSPKTAVADERQTSLTLHIYGQSFRNDTTVQWHAQMVADYVERTPTYVSPTELSLELGAADLSDPAVNTFKVSTPDAGWSDGELFFITQPAYAPVISLDPSELARTGAGRSVILAGSQFQSSSVVRWNKTPLPTQFISETELHFSLSADLLNVDAEQWVTIDVATPGLGSSGTGSLHIVNDNFRLSTTTSSKTVALNQPAVFNISVTPAQFFYNPISLSCGNVPANWSCDISNTTLTPGNEAVAVQVSITPHSAAAGTASGLGFGLIALPLFGGVVAMRSRRRRALPLVISLICLSLMLVSCGGASSASEERTVNAQSAAANQISVVATSGLINHSLSVSVVLQ